MGNCCQSGVEVVDSTSATRPLVQNDHLRTNSIYVPVPSNFNHENSVKSTTSSHRYHVSAEQAFLNGVLQNIADQVVDITSIDVASNNHDYVERAHHYEVKLPEVLDNEAPLPSFSRLDSPVHNSNPDQILSEMGGVTSANLQLIQSIAQCGENFRLGVSDDDDLVIEFTVTE